MKFYFAPMEGITNYVFRGTHLKYFPGIDKYYTPFLVANQTLHFKQKELRDIDPANNEGQNLVPQILANKADEFLWAAKEIHQRGYEEINLNLGCPCGTVVSKKKGSGFLAYPEELDVFLDEVYNGLASTGIKLSIKTRLGKDDLSLAERLVEIYNQYPVYELTVHPRTQKDMYKGVPHMDAWKKAYEQCRCPICYNSNIFNMADYKKLMTEFPDLKAVMLGRGLIMNPALARQIAGGDGLNKEELWEYMNGMWSDYERYSDLQADQILRKFKEIWGYMKNLFPEGEKQVKQIRKAKDKEGYMTAVKTLLSETEIVDDQEFWFK